MRSIIGKFIFIISVCILLLSSCSEVSILNRSTGKTRTTEFIDQIAPISSALSISREGKLLSEQAKRLVRSVTPVYVNNEIKYWAVNYENENGSVLLAAEDIEFPVAQFSYKSNFDIILERYQQKMETVILILGVCIICLGVTSAHIVRSIPSTRPTSTNNPEIDLCLGKRYFLSFDGGEDDDFKEIDTSVLDKRDGYNSEQSDKEFGSTV